ncbi:MAG: hypothetical protein RRX93_01585 [Bacteroidales bacterium]
MLKIVAIMLCGLLCGFLFRKSKYSSGNKRVKSMDTKRNSLTKENVPFNRTNSSTRFPFPKTKQPSDSKIFIIPLAKFRKILSFFISVTIFLLLFLLGISIGKDPVLISQWANLGGDALLLSLAGIIGSVLLSWGLYAYIKRHQNIEIQ